MTTPKTAFEGVELHLDANTKYRENLEEKPSYGELMGFTSFQPVELKELIDELDEKMATGVFSKLDKINHRELFTINRDYQYTNKGRRAIYVHAYRSKLIKQCIDKASKLIIERGQE